MRWLHRLAFSAGAARYSASLTYFYFDEPMRAQLFTAASTASLAGARAESAIEDPFNSLDGEALDRMLYADISVRLPDHPVMITDRMTMAHGLEARSPFMDHRLVEFAARLPTSLKIRGRSLRYIQRKLAARYLPREVLQRPKQGFSSALPYILRNEYRTLYDRFLSDAELVRAGVLARAPIEKLLREHIAGRVDHGNRLWLLINSELWYRMMILGHSRDDMRRELRGESLAAAA
jgi:asparagine synthase (glutamine-hydrolysing)